MTDLQAAKKVVLDYYDALDQANPGRVAEQIRPHTNAQYLWRGMYPFYEQHGVEAVASVWHEPLLASFSPIQRRPDIFLAGVNQVTSHEPGQPGTIWVCQMGHLLGLFDRPWVDIPPTNRMCFIRYAEFHRVSDGVIAETAMFTDVINVMDQAGCNPLPPATGASHVHPGPATHDGLLFEPQDESAGTATLDLVQQMANDLDEANRVASTTGNNHVPIDVLRKTWHDDMIWSGSEGIGATYTVDRYQHQHQFPFRYNLADKVFNGHICRIAEGDYAAWFGWPNLTNRATGGFLGLPAGRAAEMRVVDVYRRSGSKLAENWVFIDLGHWLDQQGLDVLQRMRQLRGQEKF